MFIKDRLSDESYIHVCDDKTERDMRGKGIEIRVHDVSIFTILYANDRVEMEHISYCPYCGADLEQDAFNSDIGG